MKIIRRCKSAPELFGSLFVDETITQLKKSASAQLFTEMTQLSVDDLKETTEFVENIGNNANEIAQSGIQFLESENELPSPTNKLALLFVHIMSRVFVAWVVHQLHEIMVFIFHYFNH